MTTLLGGYAPSRPAASTSVQPLEVLLLTTLSATAAVWGIAVMWGTDRLDSEKYLVLLGAYGLACAWFIVPRVKRAAVRFLDIPVFITILFLGRFGFAPLYFVLGTGESKGNLRLEPDLLPRALLYVVIGTVALWLGCGYAAPRKVVEKGEEPCLRSGGEPGARNSAVIWAIALYLMAFAAKIYLLEAHLYFFTESLDVYHANLASAQVWQTIAQLGTCALVVAAIEKYSHPREGGRRLLFYVVFASECLWGLVSGMKAPLVLNFVVVFLVASLIQHRLRAGWGLAAIFTLVLLYPVYDRYRILIRGEGMEVTSLTSARDVGELALIETLEGQEDLGSWLESGARSSAIRMDLLRSLGWVISSGEQFPWLQTKEHWWMLPFYPFVPRFLWRSKPIEDVGAKFNVALGGDNKSGSAISYLGDLYLEFGLPGIIIGMFLLGMLGQRLTVLVSDTSKKQCVLIYAVIFLNVVNFEDDVFGFWTGNIKWLTILGVLAWLIYGRRRPLVALSRFPVGAGSR